MNAFEIGDARCTKRTGPNQAEEPTHGGKPQERREPRRAHAGAGSAPERSQSRNPDQNRNGRLERSAGASTKLSRGRRGRQSSVSNQWSHGHLPVGVAAPVEPDRRPPRWRQLNTHNGGDFGTAG